MSSLPRLSLCLALLAPSLNAMPSDGALAPLAPDRVETAEGVSSRVEARDLPAPRDWQPGDPIKEIPRRDTGPRPPTPRGERAEPDPLLAVQEKAGFGSEGEAFSTLLVSVAGATFSGVYPPDTVGDVGPSHYVQAVNDNVSTGGAAVRVYNKTGGSLGSFYMEGLASSGACTNGYGDPIVLYDAYVDRWWLAEFANPSTGNSLCVYVSKTADPLGGYWAYRLSMPSFPDYPKYGIYPDAVYVGTNESAGPRVYAINKTPMLSGSATSMVGFSVTSLSGFGFQMLQPADPDGIVPPPPGSPGIFARHADGALHPEAGSDSLQLYLLQPNFATPASSTLTGPVSIPVAAFSSDFCPAGDPMSCIPQPSGSFALDPLREPVMHRLQYRNFRRHQSLVGSFVTNTSATPPSSTQAAVRWFELRNSGSGWSLHQQGTWAPNTAQRWMSSAAMDGHGNIAAGYSVSAQGGATGNIYPGLRYAGRTAAATLGTFDQAEATFHNGTTSQTTFSRWGDYASLNVDPADECTFWFTGQYGLSSSWATWIGAFKFDVCRPFVKGDLNGDRKPDLVLRNNATGAHQVWLMNGTTRTSTGNLSHNPAATQLIAGVDDFNSDNRSDLVLVTESSGAGQFWLMNGLTRTSTVNFTGQATPWKLSATADFNRDGKADLVWRNFSTQKIQIWLMNGTGSHTTALPNPDQAVDANWEIVGALDYNGDGYVDLMWYNPVSGKIVAWFLDASYVRTTGDFTNPSNAGANNWKVLASADYGVGIDGADAAAPVPGSHDLIWRNASSGKFVVWHLDYARNRTHGLFTTPDAPAAPATDWTIAGPR